MKKVDTDKVVQNLTLELKDMLSSVVVDNKINKFFLIVDDFSLFTLLFQNDVKDWSMGILQGRW